MRPCRRQARRRRTPLRGQCFERAGGHFVYFDRVCFSGHAGSISSQSDKLTSGLHLTTQPFGRDVKSIRPGRSAEFKEYAAEIGFIPQRLQHGTGLVDDAAEIVDAFAAVAKANMQPKTAEQFETCYLRQIETCNIFRPCPSVRSASRFRMAGLIPHSAS